MKNKNGLEDAGTSCQAQTNSNLERVALTMVATEAAIVKKGEYMNRFVTGWFKPKAKKLSFLTTLYCLDCGHFFESSRTGRPCVKCASASTMPAANWSPTKYGMPKFEMGKVVNDE